MKHHTPRKSTATATLSALRAHPAVAEIILESDFGRRTYWINLRPGFATDGGRGQQSGSESTLRGVAAFLRTVAAVPAEAAAPEITADNRAAAFAAATERVFSDMARNAARIEAERVKREAAAAEAAEARRNAAADFDFALISGNAAAGAAAEARFAAATEAATAASAGDFTAHAAHLARAVRPNPAAVAEAEAAEARARKRFKRAEAALTRAESADFEAAKEKANAAFADLRAAVAAVRAARLSA